MVHGWTDGRMPYLHAVAARRKRRKPKTKPKPQRTRRPAKRRAHESRSPGAMPQAQAQARCKAVSPSARSRRSRSRGSRLPGSRAAQASRAPPAPAGTAAAHPAQAARRRPPVPAAHADRRLLRHLRRAPGRAPAVARRVRPFAGHAEALPPWASPRRGVAHPPGRRGRAHRAPRPVDDDGNPLAPGGRVGPRPPLVARPHGAHQPAARGAHDARLARLVRHLARRGQPAAA